VERDGGADEAGGCAAAHRQPAVSPEAREGRCLGVAELLAKIGRGEATGQYAVTGTVELADDASPSVERIEARK
jgi:hypothetical protein